MVQLVTQDIEAMLKGQRAYFATGATRDVAFRLEQLKRLRQAVSQHQTDLVEAVQQDLRRPTFEAYTFEIGVLMEIDYAIKHLKQWAKPKRVFTSLLQFPSTAKIISEPLGVALIIGPWNYPVQLMLSPLIGAIAAGNCAVLKPSELAPHTSRAIATLIKNTFDPAYISVVEGGVEASQALLAQSWDHIFFTGGTEVGKVVMQAAAQHLTPVTLELGGKSPCFVDADVDIEKTAQRIVWGKFINAGQTCIAPDYLLVDRRIKPALIDAICATVRQFYGDDPAQSPDFGRIVSDRHFQRVSQLLASGNTILGGETNASDRYIAPTVLDQVSWNDLVMQEEIFGPILPILDYDNLDDAIAQVTKRAKPLALYIFSRDRAYQKTILERTSSGGVCINDVVLQVAESNLPFGGVGPSGLGSYHGKASFDTFSHARSVLYKFFRFDLDWRYAPYADKTGFLKKLIK
ncbi:aldehyde dehydrogenase [Leptolyngbya sp. AN02str]|uniref:aldehyde dehydrogenase n=1 Tax=Leptolyngbya sp. AN02str TaxID=3423363 RepID=UPI003D312677